MTINKNIQSEILMTTMEEIVPQDSLFRKIDKYIDFTFIYDEVKDLYCDNNGRPSIDPVVLFKLVFIQAIDGIKSMRKTCEKIKVDAEYRWFLGIPFGYETPHFSTFSKNYERRFKGTNVFEKIFINIVTQAIEHKLVDGKILYTDSTHKKANANKNKFVDAIEEVAKSRREWLEKEINEERKKYGKKEFEYKEQIEKKHIKISTTDGQSGYYHRDNKEKGFMYLDHRTVDDKCNIIVDCYVTKGNVHDSTPYTSRLDYIKNIYKFKIEKCAVDSGYDTLDIKKYFIENEIFGVIGYRSYGSSERRREKSKYYYDNELDVYVERKTGEILEYDGLLDRNGYKQYSECCSLKGSKSNWSDAELIYETDDNPEIITHEAIPKLIADLEAKLAEERKKVVQEIRDWCDKNGIVVDTFFDHKILKRIESRMCYAHEINKQLNQIERGEKV